MELYVEQLLPVIISCLVNPVQYRPSDNHFAMRDYCATLLTSIVDMYRVKYERLLPRIVSTFLREFNADNLVPFSKSYGKTSHNTSHRYIHRLGHTRSYSSVFASMRLVCWSVFVCLLVAANVNVYLIWCMPVNVMWCDVIVRYHRWFHCSGFGEGICAAPSIPVHDLSQTIHGQTQGEERYVDTLLWLY